MATGQLLQLLRALPSRSIVPFVLVILKQPFHYTSNVPARGAGTLFTGAQRPVLVSELTPKVMTTGKTPAERLGVTPGQYASNAEGGDDGKNHRYAENHVFR